LRAAKKKSPILYKAQLWAVFLIGLQCLYVILEFAFNARLVDSVLVADRSYFDHLSHVGRLLSGAGCTLFIFSLLKKWKGASKKEFIISHIVAALVAFPLVYYGQEEIINSLVDKSSPEQRQHAQHIALLKRGLASNVVVFKDIEFVPEDIKRPEAKTFINTIGFSVFFTPDYIDAVVKNSDPIIEQLAVHQASKELPDAYEKYVMARKQVSDLSDKYNQANLNYQNQSSKMEKKAQEIWRDVYLELQAQWEDRQKRGISSSLRDGLDLLYDRLEVYFFARKKCGDAVSDACVKRVNKEYRKKVESAFGQDVPPEYWCKPVKIKKTMVMQSGRFVEKISGGDLDCSVENRGFIRDQYLRIHGITSFGYQSFRDFMASTEVATGLRKKLGEKNINMPDSYRLKNHESFINGVKSELVDQLKEKFIDQSESQFNVSLPPGLDTEAFLEHPVVQFPLKDALGIDRQAEPVPLNLSERSFRDLILTPSVKNALAAERGRLMAKTAYYADGEPYAEEGKNIVRSVLVPPVAMGLSLLFGLLNLISLLFIPLSKSGINKRLVVLCRFSIVAIIIFGPMVFSSKIAKTAPFQRIVEESQESLGWGSDFVVWVTSLQPVVYPVGNLFADALGFLENGEGE
jgi:hypothetical protein